jgi:hypothetical protein
MVVMLVLMIILVHMEQGWVVQYRLAPLTNTP